MDQQCRHRQEQVRHSRFVNVAASPGNTGCACQAVKAMHCIGSQRRSEQLQLSQLHAHPAAEGLQRVKSRARMQVSSLLHMCGPHRPATVNSMGCAVCSEAHEYASPAHHVTITPAPAASMHRQCPHSVLHHATCNGCHALCSVFFLQ